MWELTVLQSGWQKTTIELFLSGVRALALQSSIIDVVRMFSGSSSATGEHCRSELAIEPRMGYFVHLGRCKRRTPGR